MVCNCYDNCLTDRVPGGKQKAHESFPKQPGKQATAEKLSKLHNNTGADNVQESEPKINAATTVGSELCDFLHWPLLT